jgi:hypothetical protein
MIAPGTRCAFCGAVATEMDHLTGCPRGEKVYLDPDLKVPCDRACNLANEHGWTATGMLVYSDPLFVVRVRRLAFGTLRLSDTAWEGPVPAGFWAGLSRLANEVADELERLS